MLLFTNYSNIYASGLVSNIKNIVDDGRSAGSSLIDGTIECLTNPCNCGGHDVHEEWGGKSHNKGPENANCIPYNKKSGRSGTCLTQYKYPEIFMPYYIRYCGENTSENSYFSPKIRARIQVCNAVACWTQTSVLNWDGQCVNWPGPYGLPMIRICARVAFPESTVEGLPQDPGYTKDKHINNEGYPTNDKQITGNDGKPIKMMPPKLCLYRDPSVLFFTESSSTPAGPTGAVAAAAMEEQKIDLNNILPDIMDINPVSQPIQDTSPNESPIVQALLFLTKEASGGMKMAIGMLSNIFGSAGSMMKATLDELLDITDKIASETIYAAIKKMGQINRVVFTPIFGHEFGCVNIPLGPYPPPFCPTLGKLQRPITTQRICHVPSSESSPDNLSNIKNSLDSMISSDKSSSSSNTSSSSSNTSSTTNAVKNGGSSDNSLFSSPSTSDNICVVSKLNNNAVSNSIRVTIDNFIPLCDGNKNPKKLGTCVTLENIHNIPVTASALHNLTKGTDLIDRCGSGIFSNLTPCVRAYDIETPLNHYVYDGIIPSIIGNSKEAFRIAYADRTGDLKSFGAYVNDLQDCVTKGVQNKQCQEVFGVNAGPFTDVNLTFPKTQFLLTMSSPLTNHFSIKDGDITHNLTASIARTPTTLKNLDFVQEPNQICIIGKDSVIGCQLREPVPEPRVYDCKSSDSLLLQCTSTQYEPALIATVKVDDNSTSAIIAPRNISSWINKNATANLAAHEFTGTVADENFLFIPFQYAPGERYKYPRKEINANTLSSIYNIYKSDQKTHEDISLFGETTFFKMLGPVTEDIEIEYTQSIEVSAGKYKTYDMLAAYTGGMEYKNGSYIRGGSYACVDFNTDIPCSKDKPGNCVLTKLLNTEISCSEFFTKLANYRTSGNTIAPCTKSNLRPCFKPGADPTVTTAAIGVCMLLPTTVAKTECLYKLKKDVDVTCIMATAFDNDSLCIIPADEIKYKDGSNSVKIYKCPSLLSSSKRYCYEGDWCRISTALEDRYIPSPSDGQVITGSKQHYDFTKIPPMYPSSCTKFCQKYPDAIECKGKCDIPDYPYYDTDIYALRNKTPVEKGLCIPIPPLPQVCDPSIVNNIHFPETQLGAIASGKCIGSPPIGGGTNGVCTYLSYTKKEAKPSIQWVDPLTQCLPTPYCKATQDTYSDSTAHPPSGSTVILSNTTTIAEYPEMGVGERTYPTIRINDKLYSIPDIMAKYKISKFHHLSPVACEVDRTWNTSHTNKLTNGVAILEFPQYCGATQIKYTGNGDGKEYLLARLNANNSYAYIPRDANYMYYYVKQETTDYKQTVPVQCILEGKKYDTKAKLLASCKYTNNTDVNGGVWLNHDRTKPLSQDDVNDFLEECASEVFGDKCATAKMLYTGAGIPNYSNLNKYITSDTYALFNSSAPGKNVSAECVINGKTTKTSATLSSSCDEKTMSWKGVDNNDVNNFLQQCVLDQHVSQCSDRKISYNGSSTSDDFYNTYAYWKSSKPGKDIKAQCYINSQQKDFDSSAPESTCSALTMAWSSVNQDSVNDFLEACVRDNFDSCSSDKVKYSAQGLAGRDDLNKILKNNNTYAFFQKAKPGETTEAECFLNGRQIKSKVELARSCDIGGDWEPNMSGRINAFLEQCALEKYPEKLSSSQPVNGSSSNSSSSNENSSSSSGNENSSSSSGNNTFKNATGNPFSNVTGNPFTNPYIVTPASSTSNPEYNYNDYNYGYTPQVNSSINTPKANWSNTNSNSSSNQSKTDDDPTGSYNFTPIMQPNSNPDPSGNVELPSSNDESIMN
ncbi:MAG: hypothetical protein AB8B67_03250 [Rickettsiaceae bacterium]